MPPRSARRTSAAALLFVAMGALLGACSSPDDVVVPTADPGTVASLTSAQGRALIDSDRKALVIDVRPVAEYRGGHLVGAQSIDASDPDAWSFRIPELDRDRPTVVYCSIDACSATAAQDLVDAGFTEVYDLGGVDSWDQKLLAVEAPESHQPLENPNDGG
jgi:phage shock protein E